MPLYKRGKRWWIEYEHEGKRYRESAGRTKRLARDALSIRRAEIAQGKFNIQAVKRSPTLDEFAQEYLAWAKVNLRSAERYHATKLKPLLRAFGNLRLSAITTSLIERYKQERAREVRPHPTRRGKRKPRPDERPPQPLQPATVNRELAVLSTILTKAVEWGRLAVHPMRGGKVKKLPGEQKRDRVLTDEEETHLLKASPPEIRDAIILALQTGMRLGDLCSLTPATVDLPRGEIYLPKPKNAKPRRLPLTPAARAVLTLRLTGRGPTDRLFPTKDGKRPWRLDTAFGRACAKAKITGLRFHDLRHTFATRLVTGGADLVTVRDLLGHSDLRMTSRYAHSTGASIQQALDILTEQRWVPTKVPTTNKTGLRPETVTP
jgi:integrase